MRTTQEQSPPHSAEFMDNMSYTTSNQYLPPSSQYYSTPHVNHGHAHVVAPPPRPETTQRKRPKYTRSKTGCMTCRVKKIKCDETKPNCMRCTHGQRDCTWPEGVPARKKSVVRKDSGDGRPSTAGSSGLSEGSTPPTREHTPPRRSSVDIGLIPLASRRPADSYLLHPTMSSEPEPTRRLTASNDRIPSGYPHPPTNSNTLTMIPETSSYPTQPRYDHPYNHGHAVHSSRHAAYRPLNHEPVGQWNQTSEYFSAQDRGLVAAHIPNDAHTRYQ